MTTPLRDTDDELDKITDMAMLDRVCEPDEQAGAAVFLLSDHASCKSVLTHAESGLSGSCLTLDITATELKVDGGYTAW